MKKKNRIMEMAGLRHRSDLLLEEEDDLFGDDDSVVNGIHCFKFNKSDIVRSKILKFIISKLESYKKV